MDGRTNGDEERVVGLPSLELREGEVGLEMQGGQPGGVDGIGNLKAVGLEEMPREWEWIEEGPKGQIMWPRR